MAQNLISSTLPNLIGGVSQQPWSVRLPTQCEEQINCMASVTDFLRRRPATRHVAKIIEDASSVNDAAIHIINRDETERYIVIVTKNNIMVFDLDGNEKTVANKTPEYLDTDTPTNNIRFLTINDYTFILNNKIPVKMLDAEEDLSPVRQPEALVFIKQASYNTTYTLTLEGRKYSFTTLDGVAPADKPADELSSTQILEGIAKQIQSMTVSGVEWNGTLSGEFNGTISGQYYKKGYYDSDGKWHDATWNNFQTTGLIKTNNVSCIFSGSVTNGELNGTFTSMTFTEGTYASGYRNLTFSGTFKGASDPEIDAIPSGAKYRILTEGSTMWIRRIDGEDFECKIEDTRSNTHTSMCKNKTQTFSDLLTVAPDGYVVEVTGDAGSSFDNYYVKFKCNNEMATFDEGLWVETVKPGIPYKLDASTMPHTLVRNADGTFTFDVEEWGNRTCGDEDNARDPSFVGRTISGMLFYRNRLSFLSWENLIMSKAGEFFEFFVSTVTTMLDNDPIDVAASHTRPTNLEHAASYTGGLLLFSDSTQFVLEHDSVLANSSVSIRPVTEFEADMLAAPVSSGKTIFFSTRRGEYSGVREYYTLPDNADQNDAADVTAHVPRYVRGRITKQTCSTNEDLLFVHTDKERNKLYVYKYFWNGREKTQSCWGTWLFGGEVLATACINTTLYLVLKYPEDGIYIEKCEIEPGHKDEGSSFEYCIDRKITEAALTNAAHDLTSKTTTFTLPYAPQRREDVMVVTREGGNLRTGVVLDILDVRGNVITVKSLLPLNEETGQVTEPLFAGIVYESTYTFSTLSLREQSSTGGQGSAVLDGRLQLRRLTLNCCDTGYMEVNVSPLFRDLSKYIFTGREMGNGTNRVGEISLYTGAVKVPVLSMNTQAGISVRSRSFLPFALVNATWEGFYNTRSTRR